MTDLFRDRVLALVSPSPLYDEEQFELLYPACLTFLAAGLRAGVDPQRDCPDAFALAAAWLILDRMSAQEGQDNVTAITAGSVSVTRSAAGAASSNSLEKQALALLRPWMKDPSFAFRGVPG